MRCFSFIDCSSFYSLVYFFQLEKATNYDERFKVRTRIRMVKKMSTTTASSSLFSKVTTQTRSTDSAAKTPKSQAEDKLSKFKRSQEKFEQKTVTSRDTVKEQKKPETVTVNVTAPADEPKTPTTPRDRVGRDRKPEKAISEPEPEPEPVRVPSSRASPSAERLPTSQSPEGPRDSPPRRSSRSTEPTEDELRQRRGSRSSRRGSRSEPPAPPPIVQEPDEVDRPGAELGRLKMEYASRLFHSSDPLDRPKIEELPPGHGEDGEDSEEESEREEDSHRPAEKEDSGAVRERSPEAPQPEKRSESPAELPECQVDSEDELPEPDSALEEDLPKEDVSTREEQLPKEDVPRDESPKREVLSPTKLPKDSPAREEPKRSPSPEKTRRGAERQIPRPPQFRTDRDRDFRSKAGAEPLKSKVDKFESKSGCETGCYGLCLAPRSV